LHRKVAVKTLRIERSDPAAREAMVQLLLDEARIVGKLAHPNIVPLFDAGEHQGLPYLVFEFVAGQPLSEVLRARGKLPVLEAVQLALGMLRGIECAHQQNIVHRDIKPANIMLIGEVPRIMDFGIASRTDGALGTQSNSGGLSGTPRYMAPEYLSGGEFTPSCDLFALGMVLYEMLCGKPAVGGSDVYAIMNAMVNKAFLPPSRVNPEIDERLDAIVMRAIAKDPAARYASPGEMMAALTAYARPQTAAPDEESGHGILEFVLRRMRYKSDFPVLSSTIASINKLMASEDEPASALADGILKDVALTNKVLRMVNTASFSQFGGSVSTVSRAVSILGFQKVRAAALSLMLFEHLQNKTQAADLKDQVSASYFSGVLSRELAAALGFRNAEEAFICAMFHRLGKLLATFYLHEESADVARLARAEGMDEDEAAEQVLGLSYTGLGLGVAEKWNFPAGILGSMRVPAAGAPVLPPANDAERMCALAGMATRMADAVRLPAGAQREAALAKIANKYGHALNINARQMATVLKHAARTFVAEAASLDLRIGSGDFVQKLRLMDGAPLPEPETAESAADRAAGEVLDDTVLNTRPPGAARLAGGPTPVAASREGMLAAGISDITNTLAGPYDLNDVLRIILETMFRAIGFTRVLLCTNDARSNTLKGRFGFGGDIDGLVKRGFAIPLTGSRDVFYAALSKGADICIEDVEAEKIRSYVPDWYRALVRARGFFLFPVMVNKKPLALIYADGDDSATLRLSDSELSLLKTLRNQAILAIRQKSSG
ncbi:MAG TPA: HDOD domain-containing protein, partial [Burkholderiales bacterium]|nr:HDOD domain-containing protein [Burkholderiales bacterium]